MVIRFKRFVLVVCLFITLSDVYSQNYHAIQGSSYAGSLGIANNPASIVNTPFPWDVTVISGQLKNATNAFKILNYSLLSSPRNSMYSVDGGDYSRYIHADMNLHLLNARIALGREQAIGFGVNLRSYSRVKSAPYNFIDTVSTLREFLVINEGTPELEGDFNSSTWIEVFGTYSRTIWDRETDRLNGGITLKLNRGISGGYLSLRNTGVQKRPVGNRTNYFAATGNANYGYSSNYDTWKDDKSNKDNALDFIKTSQGSISFDLGAEYLVKSQEVSTFDDADNYYDYEWKIGVALLDIGSNKYRYGVESRAIADPQPDFSDIAIQNRFQSVTSLRDFNDSLEGLVRQNNALPGEFYIINPTRLVLNVDKPVINDFYVNGELSLNLSSLAVNKLFAKEINLLTVTPRWETRRWGAYIPLQYNTENKFWMGAAFKAGPLLLGVHNVATLFAKNRMQNGGAYFALVIRPGSNTGSRQDRRYDCPEY